MQSEAVDLDGCYALKNLEYSLKEVEVELHKSNRPYW